MRAVALGLFALAACASAGPVTPPPQVHPLGWLTGCWISEDGTSKEVWSEMEAGYLFGYAVTYGDGGVSFFEQTRIQPGPLYVYNAYPAGEGPFKFVESLQGDQSVTFLNNAHDYPQLIHYERRGDRLSAHIALEDGSRRQDYEFRACPD